jgi:small-conductance mechanosensitive channel
MTNPLKNKLFFLKNQSFFFAIFYRFIFLLILGHMWYLNKDFINSHNILYNSMFLLFNYLLLNLIFNYGKLFIIFIYFKKNKLQTGYTDNLTVGVERVSFFLNHFIFILIVVDLLFIEIKLLLTSLSIVAVALVLIFKDYISNFLNGLNLMFSKDFRLKDTVKIGDNKGKIVDFTFHNVQLKNDSGDIIYIPNSTFLTKEIINYSKTSLKNISIDAIILRKDITKFEKNKNILIKNIFQNFSENINIEDNINIFITKLEKETATLSFELYLSKHSNDIEKSITSYILTQIGTSFPNPNKK